MVATGLFGELPVGDDRMVGLGSEIISQPARIAPAGYGPPEKVGIDFSKSLRMGRQIILIPNGFDRADGHANRAIYALIRVDIKHPTAFINAIDRANIGADAVFDVDACLGDDVGHGLAYLPFQTGLRFSLNAVTPS